MLPHTTVTQKCRRRKTEHHRHNKRTHTHSQHDNTQIEKDFFNFVHTRRLLINCQLQMVLYASPGFSFGLPSFCLDFFGPTPPIFIGQTSTQQRYTTKKKQHTYTQFARTTSHTSLVFKILNSFLLISIISPMQSFFCWLLSL